MKVLYVQASVQHPTMRGALRPYHFLRNLSRSHSITLLALANTDVTREAMQDLSRHTSRIVILDVMGNHCFPCFDKPRAVSALAKRVYRAFRRRSAIKKMKRVFLELVRQESYDLVLFHGKDTYPVIEGWNKLPIVADFCDATAYRLRKGLRYASRTELWWRLWCYWEARRIDGKLLRKTPYVVFISSRDRAAAGGAGPQSKVIPNGVDLAYWTRKTSASQPGCIVFTGVMNYPPNTDAAFYLIERILPLVRRSMPSVEALIVGWNPSPALVEAARGRPGVTVTGYVEDIRPYLERACVFVAPLRFASGLQNKVLEAMAMSVPVVTTPVVAAGLRVEGCGEPPLQVAEGEDEFAERLLDLLGSAEERAHLAREGRQFVERHFDWARSAAMLEEVCLEAVSQNHSRQEEVGRAQKQTPEAVAT